MEQLSCGSICPCTKKVMNGREQADDLPIPTGHRARLCLIEGKSSSGRRRIRLCKRLQHERQALCPRKPLTASQDRAGGHSTELHTAPLTSSWGLKFQLFFLRKAYKSHKKEFPLNLKRLRLACFPIASTLLQLQFPGTQLYTSEILQHSSAVPGDPSAQAWLTASKHARSLPSLTQLC